MKFSGWLSQFGFNYSENFKFYWFFPLKSFILWEKKWKFCEIGIYVTDLQFDLQFLVRFIHRKSTSWWNTMNIFFLGLIIQLTTALQLEGLATKKPRLTKYTMKPQGVINFLLYARQRSLNFLFPANIIAIKYFNLSCECH